MALRQGHLGRAVAALIAALLVAWPALVRAEGSVFLIPVGDGLREPAERDKLEPLIGAMGFGQVSWVELADIEAHITVESIMDLQAEDSCGGTIDLQGWSDRLGRAQELVQLLQVDRALGELAGLTLDVACLGQVPRQQDLFMLSLVTAEAHAMATATVQDLGIRLFHEAELGLALENAAGFGPDLPPPSWLAPELRQQLLDVQARYALGESVPVYLGGTAKGLWLDGQHVTTGYRHLSPGAHLVQATWGKDVVAARMVEIERGRRTIVRVTPGEVAAEHEDLIIGLERLAAGAGADPLIGDLLGLMAEDADDALVICLTLEGPNIWGRGRGGVVLRYPGGDLEPRATSFEEIGEEPAPPVRPPRPPPLPWTLGVGPALLWSSIGGGPLEGLGGLSGGFAVDTRISFAELFAVAATIHPVARGESLPAGYDDSWLWRAQIPLRIGLRVGSPVPRPCFELGVDGGLVYLGKFQDHEFRALGILSTGLFLPLTHGFGLRLELWGGVGKGLYTGGFQLIGVAHKPAPLDSETM